MISASHFSGGFSFLTAFNKSESLFLLESSQKSCDPISGTFTDVYKNIIYMLNIALFIHLFIVKN